VRDESAAPAGSGRGHDHPVRCGNDTAKTNPPQGNTGIPDCRGGADLRTDGFRCFWGYTVSGFQVAAQKKGAGTEKLRYAVAAGSMLALALAMIVPLHGSEWAFTGIIPGRHRGPVNALVHKENIILSAGEDGFLEIWNVSGSGAGSAAERFQASPYSIIAMAERPEKNEVCLVENDGLGLYRISAWNYRERRHIFTLPFMDPIASVSYSMGGKFIIAAKTGRTGLALIDSVSGNVLPSPQSLTGNVGLAVTGKSERNMLVYLTWL